LGFSSGLPERASASGLELGLDASLCGAIAAEADARGELSPELPGMVYERARAADRSERRASAVYYTPPHLVDFTVDRALGPLLARSRGLPRVLDPACGGGAFLLAALRAIEARVGRGKRLAILRRSLHGIDVDPQAAAVCRLALSLAVPEATPADLARAVTVADALAADSAPAAGFDAVVTNPPWGQKRFRLTAEERRRYRAAFVSARGAIDPFALFVERAHALLAPGGRWGMVLPDVVLLKNHEPLRRFLLERSALEWIAHAGRAFAGVNLDAVVMVGRAAAARPAARHRVSIWLSLPEAWRECPPPTRRQHQAVFGRLAGHCFNLHLEPADLALLERLGELPRLGERFEIHEGAHSGNARAKLFLPERPPGRKDGDVAPLVFGALDRAAGDYANLGRPEWHRRAKILVRRTGDHLVAAHDPHGFHASNNLFLVLPRAPASAAGLRAMVAVLNSRLLTWCFRAMVPRVGRLFAELKIQHLAALPHPPDAMWTAGAVAELDRLARRRARVAAPSSSAAELDRAIDERVEALYRLTPAERRHIMT
jgi:tRNA1(Val) A37 N6-methylase TrmN6